MSGGIILPKPVPKAINDLMNHIEDLPETWRIVVSRYTGDKGEHSFVKTFFTSTPISLSDIIDEVRQQFGGGSYLLKLVDPDGRYVKSKQFNIPEVSKSPRSPVVQKELDDLLADAKFAPIPTTTSWSANSGFISGSTEKVATLEAEILALRKEVQQLTEMVTQPTNKVKEESVEKALLRRDKAILDLKLQLDAVKQAVEERKVSNFVDTEFCEEVKKVAWLERLPSVAYRVVSSEWLSLVISFLILSIILF